MTELGFNDINLDITYQDGLRLSELYGKLGELQYNLDHFDIVATNTRISMAIIFALLGILLGFVIFMALVYFFEGYTKRDNIIIFGGLAMFIALWLVLFYFVQDWAVMCEENNIMRDIQSTQMQIDAIKLKYGWT